MSAVKVFHTVDGIVAEIDGQFIRINGLGWDALLNETSPAARTREEANRLGTPIPKLPQLLAPISQQEVWAAGVTYLRSSAARQEESAKSGGSTFYEAVYDADRPEIFFKAAGHRVVGSDQPIRTRADSNWDVPEPELTLVVSSGGDVVGYTVGNDVSSRDIEGQNPLYLPQAKIFDGSCAIGPCVLLTDEVIASTTEIEMIISRNDAIAFSGSTTLASMKRELSSLVECLFRHTSFPNGVYLMTGTGIVPPDEFTLLSGDQVSITIAPIGTLVNRVA